MKLTKDELYFIEKIFDQVAYQETNALAKFIEHLSNSKVDTDRGRLSAHIKNVIRESVETFDHARTISAKCRLMQGRDKNDSSKED